MRYLCGELRVVSRGCRTLPDVAGETARRDLLEPRRVGGRASSAHGQPRLIRRASRTGRSWSQARRAPFFVHHQADPAVDAAHQLLRLGERRRQRLLADDVDAAQRRVLNPGGVVSRGEAMSSASISSPASMASRSVVDLGNAELLGAVPRVSLVRVAHRDEPDPIAERLPTQQVVAADHPGAGERHAERRRAYRVAMIYLPKPKTRAGFAHSTAARRSGVSSHRPTARSAAV